MVNDPSLQAVIDALTMYQNDLETLQAVVKAAEASLGDDWISLLPSVLDKAELEASQKDLLKERADHAIHYYGATAAYSEIQEYLKDPAQLDKTQVAARLPVLEYWMEFFGDEGMNLVRTLKTKLEPEEAASSPQWDAQVEKVQQETQEAEETPAVDEQMVDESKLFDSPEGTPADAVAQAFENILRPDGKAEPEEVAEEPVEPAPVAEEAPAEVAVKESAEEVTPEAVEQPAEEPAEQVQEIAEPTSVETPAETVEASEEVAPVEQEPAAEEISAPEIVEPAPQDEVAEMQEPAADDIPLDKDFPTTLEEAEAQAQVEPVQRENTNKDWEVENVLREWHLYEDVFAWLNARSVRLKLSDKRNYPYYGFLVDLMRTLHDDAQALLDNAKYEAVLPTAVEGGREAIESLVAALDKEILDLADEYPASVEEQLNPKKVEDILGPLDTGPEEDVGPDPNDFEAIEDPYEAAKKEEEAKEAAEEAAKKEEKKSSKEKKSKKQESDE
ncbi:MAG: hypothetical protein ILP11_01735 [Alphaproteobacteria bacterium]|nr:hypothetical protein [Alphaproteobacteria bacterium]